MLEVRWCIFWKASSDWGMENPSEEIRVGGRETHCSENWCRLSQNRGGLRSSGLASSDLTTALLDLRPLFSTGLCDPGFQIRDMSSWPTVLISWGCFYRPGQIDTLAFTGDRELLSSWKFNTCSLVWSLWLHVVELHEIKLEDKEY